MLKAILKLLLIICLLVQMVPASWQDVANKCEDDNEQTAEKKMQEDADGKWLFYAENCIDSAIDFKLSSSHFAKLRFLFISAFVKVIHTPPPDGNVYTV